LIEGVVEGNRMTMSSILLCLLMKIIRLAIKPSLISRCHPKTKGGVGNLFERISLRRYHLVKAI
jgi:hypothetical protein